MIALAESPDERGVWRRAAPLLRGHRLALAVVIALNLLAAGATVAGFALLGAVTEGILAGDRPAVARAVVAYLVLALASILLAWAARYLVVRLGEAVLRALRERAVAAVAAAPLRFLEAHRHGELLRRTTGELAELSTFVGATLPGVAASVVLLVVTVVVLAGYSLLLASVVVVLTALATAVIGRGFLRRAATVFAERAAAESAVSASFSESVAARDEIAGLGARSRRVEVLAATDRRLLAARVAEVRTERWLLALTPVGGLVLAVVLALAAVGVDRGWLEVGGAVVFVFASRTAWGDVEDLIVDLGDVRIARTHLARVLDLLAAAETTGATEDVEVDGAPDDIPWPAGTLAADRVGFAYVDGEPVLHEVSLRIEPGERVVIVGETGSGKTTLGKVLAGLYPPTTGTVAYAGRALPGADPAALRRRIAVVPQEVVLVAGTVADNLAARSTTPSAPDPYEVARALGLGGWLAALPAGLETPVGEHGARLSAGERQLVALWRAALLDPEVLVLDEATADVDPVTAARIEDALAQMAGGRTVVVIAHRADTIARADRVIRLDAGRVVGG